MIQAVVFDMDGVLIDTERIYGEVWLEVGDQWGMTDIKEIIAPLTGLNATDTRIFFMDRYGPDFPYDPFMQSLHECFTGYVEKNGVPLKKGVRELLDYLHERKLPIALATSTRRETTEKHLRDDGIFDDFPIRITGDMVTHGKPDPEIYQIACRALKMPPEVTAAIEDSPNGLRSASRAGMKPIMVPDQIPDNEELAKIYYAKCDSLLDVIPLLEKERN